MEWKEHEKPVKKTFVYLQGDFFLSPTFGLLWFVVKNFFENRVEIFCD